MGIRATQLPEQSRRAAPRLPAVEPARPADRSSRRRAVLSLVAAVLLLAAAVVASLALGARAVPPAVVWAALTAGDPSYDAGVVRDVRVPRTLAGLLVGAGLGVAGGLMQALTRNPLADPGLLGINAGAAAGVVTGIVLLGLTAPLATVWLGFAGAALAAVLVHVLGGARGRGATPERLVLAGVAVAATLAGVTSGLLLVDARALDQVREWTVGTLVNRDPALLASLAPFVVGGVVLALALARSLNALALGDDVAAAIGVQAGRARVVTALAVVLLCGAATAVAGPVGFLGLVVPHVARPLVGPDQRWLLPLCALGGPVLLLACDVAGRLLARPGELPVGVVTALVGAPLLVAVVRRRAPLAL